MWQLLELETQGPNFEPGDIRLITTKEGQTLVKGRFAWARTGRLTLRLLTLWIYLGKPKKK